MIRATRVMSRAALAAALVLDACAGGARQDPSGLPTGPTCVPPEARAGETVTCVFFGLRPGTELPIDIRLPTGELLELPPAQADLSGRARVGVSFPLPGRYLVRGWVDGVEDRAEFRVVEGGR